ncbi:MAG: ribonuclease E/G, partial [Sphingomonas sp.]|nr:ribonuclease E/G [Sphingomonas sp.]
TLGSSAPALIYRDSDLIKRAIRDLYNREIDEVIVEGDEGYKAARGFMKLLMPSHVRRVKQHVETTPLFQRYGAEDQLSAMYQPLVQLKSGGYLVINPTEALVSIDINSGRSTREHNIEQTAFATNLEAAAEIARQLRLRDMAGLIVIDFIDMEQSGHVRKVEKAMKEALKNDRARIQIGRISSFGLMEMSRQRLRTGVLEASTKACPHCEGSGLMRTASSSGLSALRIIEDEAARGRGDRIVLRAGREAAIYLLNKKRAELADIESRYGVAIEVTIDEAFEGAKMSVESSGPRPEAPSQPAAEPAIEVEDETEIADELEDEGKEEKPEDIEEEPVPARGRRDQRPETRSDAEGDAGRRKRRRRRRGGRGRRRPDGTTPGEDQPQVAGESSDQPAAEAEMQPEPAAEEAPKSRTRRRPRSKPAPEAPAVEPDSSPMAERPIDLEPPIAEVEATPEAQPKKRSRRRKKGEEPAAAVAEDVQPAEPAPQAAAEEPAAGPKPRRRSRKAAPAELVSEPAEADSEPAPPMPDYEMADSEAGGELRRGWWQRTFG